MKKEWVLIAGGGQFGERALDYVKKNDFSALLIDNDPNCFVANHTDQKIESIESFIKKKQTYIKSEIIFLVSDISIISKISSISDFKYVIPVVPVHLMANLIELFLKKRSINLKPDINLTEKFAIHTSDEILLNYALETGQIFLSYAKKNETCPDNCPGPPDYCPTFKREKPITITNYVRDYFKIDNFMDIKINKMVNIIITINSYQIIPGLGGLKGEEIALIFKELRKIGEILHKKNFNLIVSTTCNCHGVLNFYRKKEKT